MNYLAHAFLSFSNKDILAGNMISDFIKGRAQFDFELSVQKGIRLHRLIDTFTDTHQATAFAKNFFRKEYRLYSGAFVDVLYDHFLSLDIKYFETDATLMWFSQQTYSLLDENFSIFPLRFQKSFSFMKQQNWLYNYQFMAGIENSFRGIAHRAAYINESATAFNIFKTNYDELKKCYYIFFDELYNYSRQTLNNLLAE